MALVKKIPPETRPRPSAIAMYVLSDGKLYVKPTDYNPFEEMELLSDDIVRRRVWAEARAEILGLWKKRYPGTKPSAAEEYD